MASSNGGSLEGLVAVVTGANRGIGYGIAKALGSQGAYIAICARDEIANSRAVRELQAVGIVAHGYRCDATRPDEIDRAIESILREYGRLDIGVANAGGALRHDFLEQSVESFESGVRLNLLSAFLLFQRCARAIVSMGRGGSLIAVSSCSAIHGQPGSVDYAAAKAGLGGLVRTVAVELAAHRIRVNALMPGWTSNSKLSEGDAPDSLRTETVASIPAGRWGTPDDLGRAAAFLADPSLYYHTGTELRVDGGYGVIAPYLAVRKGMSISD